VEQQKHHDLGAVAECKVQNFLDSLFSLTSPPCGGVFFTSPRAGTLLLPTVRGVNSLSLLFDVNTLLVFRTFFCTETVVERNGRRLLWRGQGVAEQVKPGAIGTAILESNDASIATHTHRQRHFTEPELLGAIEAAGLECREIDGELDGELEDSLDESLHTKAVYVCLLA
jgi:hypothetical protein